MKAAALIGPALRTLRPRLLGLAALAALFLLIAGGAALLLRGEHGQVELDQLFLVGGYPLASAMLLLGWLLGRYPLIAALVLLAGIFSADRSRGDARLFFARPASPLAIYGLRFLVLAALAFALSALLLPLFDVLMLGGRWAGPATFVLAAAQILVYGSLTALLSVWTRADAWIALLIAIAAITWNAIVAAGVILVPPGPRELVTFLLPPQWALFQLESAFGALQPIPWPAFGWAAGYSAALLALAALSLRYREV